MSGRVCSVYACVRACGGSHCYNDPKSLALTYKIIKYYHRHHCDVCISYCRYAFNRAIIPPQRPPLWRGGLRYLYRITVTGNGFYFYSS